MHRPYLIAAALTIGILVLLFAAPMSTPPTAHVLAYPAPASTPTDELFPPTNPPGPTQGGPPTPPPGASTPILPPPTFDPDTTPPPGVSTPTPAPEPVYLPLIVR